MGAVPVALLVGFAGPGDLPLAWAQEMISGIADESARVGATVVGGDTSSSERIVLAVTALGDLGGRDPVTRAGARPGDVLAIAGVLGSSAAGLALLEAGQVRPISLIAAHRRPRPPYQAGPKAAGLGATSMIDVSDGLIADAGHIAEASGVLIDISTKALPASPELAAAASALGRADWLDWVLAGGEDHALAATFPAEVALPPGWAVTGQVRAGQGVLVNGEPFTGAAGWNHFGR
jgi:thiamine-monophosphate kinase